jgi:glutamine cyclotransferase
LIASTRRQIFACALVGLLGVGGASADTRAPVEIGYRVVATYPHDRLAYTQGLLERAPGGSEKRHAAGGAAACAAPLR